ncbi:hypothetical protein [Virgisporangium aurantiacum]|nr:hypothetical protein [Virgisporangium aurantiacum]
MAEIHPGGGAVTPLTESNRQSAAAAELDGRYLKIIERSMEICPYLRMLNKALPPHNRLAGRGGFQSERVLDQLEYG